MSRFVLVWAVLACLGLLVDRPSIAVPLRIAPPTARERCCKVCHRGCACGDSCIDCSKTCTKGPECACDG